MTVHVEQVPALSTITEVWPALKDYMPRCRDCRWWQHKDVFGLCRRTEYEGRKAYGLGDPLIVTEPDFGCVQWEPKA